MAKINSMRMVKNKTLSGSLVKVCAAEADITITQIAFGTPIINPTPGTNTGGAITSSAGSPWTTNKTAIEIFKGTCMDASGMAAIATGNANDDIPLVYYRGGMLDGPNTI